MPLNNKFNIIKEIKEIISIYNNEEAIMKISNIKLSRNKVIGKKHAKKLYSLYLNK